MLYDHHVEWDLIINPVRLRPGACWAVSRDGTRRTGFCWWAGRLSGVVRWAPR
jgi:hypothetical protein